MVFHVYSWRGLQLFDEPGEGATPAEDETPGEAAPSAKDDETRSE